MLIPLLSLAGIQEFYHGLRRVIGGLCEVDDLWFKYAAPGQVFGFPVKFCPPEEMIWSKAFVMERERVICGTVERNLVTARQLQGLAEPIL